MPRKNNKEKSATRELTFFPFFVNGRWEVRQIKWKTSEKKKEMSGEWCLLMHFFFFCPCSEFYAAVLVPRWEREQCLSEINTTQSVRKGEGRERDKGRQS